MKNVHKKIQIQTFERKNDIYLHLNPLPLVGHQGAGGGLLWDCLQVTEHLVLLHLVVDWLSFCFRLLLDIRIFQYSDPNPTFTFNKGLVNPPATSHHQLSPAPFAFKPGQAAHCRNPLPLWTRNLIHFRQCNCLRKDTVPVQCAVSTPIWHLSFQVLLQKGTQLSVCRNCILSSDLNQLAKSCHVMSRGTGLSHLSGGQITILFEEIRLIFICTYSCKLSVAPICVGCLSPKWGNFSHRLAKLMVREPKERWTGNLWKRWYLTAINRVWPNPF